MIAGTVVLIVWKETGMGKEMYEIVPGFIVNSVVVWIISRIRPQADNSVLSEYDEVKGGL